MMRWRLVLALCALVFIGIWADPLYSQAQLRTSTSTRSHPTTVLVTHGDPVLYEIRIQDIDATTIKAYDSEIHVFVPFKQILDFTGIAYTIDSVRKRVTFNKRTLALNPATTFWEDNALYVPLSMLTIALGIDALIDRTEAAILFSNTSTLPVVRQAARQAAREALAMATTATNGSLSQPGFGFAPPLPPLMTPSSTWGSVLFDYALYRQQAGSRSSTNYTVAGATRVGPGTLVARTSSFGRRAAQEVTWFGVWPETHELKQLRLGYGSSSGVGALPIHGLYVSNAPLSRPSQFNVMQLAGTLPPDWSIEAYRNGTLIGFDTIGSNGRFMLDVPVQYGENPFDLVAYGPSGETVQFGRMIRTKPSMIPKGESEFSASTGVCSSSIYCNWMMNLDFRYGLSNRWSIRGGASEYTWRNGEPVNVYPYVGLDGVLGYGVSLNAEFLRRGYTQVGMSWDPTQSFMLMGNYAEYAQGEAGAMFANGTRKQLWMSTRWSVPRVPVSLEAQLTQIQNTGKHTFLRTGSSIMLNGATLRPYVRLAQSLRTRTTSYGMDAVISGNLLPVSSLRSWALRSTVEAQHSGKLTYAEAMLSRSMFFGFSGEAGMRWYAGSQPFFAVSISTDIGQVRSQVNTAGTFNNGLLTAQQAFSGSARWDADTRQVVRSADPILDRAGISGIVFVDVNLNGVQEPDEPAVSKANVTVDGTTVISNARGYYELWGVAPGQIVTVSIDAGTLESPWWIPALGTVRVATVPNQAVSLNLPIVTGGIIEGTIVSDDIPPNIPITFTHRETGRVHTVLPFSDGTFYQMGFLPGLYDATVSPKTLERYNAVSSPVLVLVKPGETSQVEVFVSRAR